MSISDVFPSCSPNTLHQVAAYLCLLPELSEGENTTNEIEFLFEMLVSDIWRASFIAHLDKSWLVQVYEFKHVKCIGSIDFGMYFQIEENRLKILPVRICELGIFNCVIESLAKMVTPNLVFLSIFSVHLMLTLNQFDSRLDN